MLTGIVRSVDELGRIVIPSEWRRELGLEPGNIAEMRKNRDTLSVKVLKEGETPVGIDKKIDSLGRVVVPAEWRRELDINKETPIEMSRFGDEIQLKIKEEVCCICRVKPEEGEVTLRLHNKIICGSCKKQIAQN